MINTQSKITPEDLEDAYAEKIHTSPDTVVNAHSMTPRERAGLLISTARVDSVYPIMKAETDALAMYQRKTGEEKAYWREVLYLIQMAGNR